MQLTVNGLVKSYGKKEVLKGATFTFEGGKIYGLLGRNGAGKTTLFNCINKDVKLGSGSITLTENGVSRPLAAQDVGYVLSEPTVPEFLTAREFLRFFLDIHTGHPAPDDVLEQYMQDVHLAPEDYDRLMKDFSHGMKNKMQMLINILAQPNVMLLDEPLTSLDVVVAEEMKEILRNVKTDRVVIFSTHLMDLALDLCDEIVLLSHGVLEKVERSDLDDDGFRERIIQALREENHG